MRPLHPREPSNSSCDMQAFRAANTPAVRSHYINLSHRHASFLQRSCVSRVGCRAYKASQRRRVVPENQAGDSQRDALPPEVLPQPTVP